MNSQIILCKGINLDIESINVLNFSESDMLTLCQSKAIASSNKYSFIDNAKGYLLCDFDYDTCLQSNYIAFQNPNYTNKWFFAFVTDVIYRGDKNTEIRFNVDSWSTWFEKLTIKSCFVQREHVSDDTIGKHTIPENIDVGNAICDSELVNIDLSDLYIVVATNYKPTGTANINGSVITPRNR